MRKIEEILKDLDSDIQIPSKEIRDMCKHIQTLEISNISLSSCVNELRDRIEMLDPFCTDQFLDEEIV